MSKIHKLPLPQYRNLPAIPIELRQIPGTLLKLGIRSQESKQATYGLSTNYTIGGITAPAYPFLFGESESTSEDDDSASVSEAPQDNDEDESKLEQLVGDVKKTVDKIEGAIHDTVDKVQEALHLDSSDSDEDPDSHRADHGAKARKKLLSMALDKNDLLTELLSQKAETSSPMPVTGTIQTAATTSAAPSMTQLSLEHPEQFSLSWTHFAGVARHAEPVLAPWAASLTDADQASEQFWPIIANHGLAYNLLILEKIPTTDPNDIRGRFGNVWQDAWNVDLEQGLLYVIDLSIFETIEVQEADGSDRFTPATLTLLRQDQASKQLTPLAVRVSGFEGSGARAYVRGQATDGAWIYALVAAKTSITVYGIWLGHVYQWHLVTAAMQMTMFDTFPENHPIYELLAPQSDYLIAFDNVLLLLWESVAPPTSITSAGQFLDLCNTFADGRRYFDDDPPNVLEQQGIRVEDFTLEEPWDLFPIAGDFLTIWTNTEIYVKAFVEDTYPDDAAVQNDEDLQSWIKASSSPLKGNVHGLPPMTSRSALTRVLTSFLYRIVAHGGSRLNTSANPGLTFVSNYPPCLQSGDLPETTEPLSTEELLELLPQTGTIGKMVTFYFTFAFSAPYEPLIPLDGVEANLFFDGGSQDPKNEALITFREAMIDFMVSYEQNFLEINQMPLNIET